MFFFVLFAHFTITWGLCSKYWEPCILKEKLKQPFSVTYIYIYFFFPVTEALFAVIQPHHVNIRRCFKMAATKPLTSYITAAAAIWWKRYICLCCKILLHYRAIQLLALVNVSSASYSGSDTFSDTAFCKFQLVCKNGRSFFLPFNLYSLILWYWIQ